MHRIPHRLFLAALLTSATLLPACSGGQPGPAAPAPASLQAAEEHIKKREFEPAVAMLKQLVDQPGADALAYQRLAEAYLHMDELSKGVLVLRQGLERFPDNGRLSYSL